MNSLQHTPHEFIATYTPHSMHHHVWLKRKGRIMKRRRRVEPTRLDARQSPQEQFHALKQIKSLTNEECRQVIGLLHATGKHQRTCTQAKDMYGPAQDCLRAFKVDGLEVPYMSLAALLQAKCDSCAFYRRCLHRAASQHENKLRLIVYSDETHGGNVLAAPAARKVVLIYVAWLEFPILYWEQVWLTACVLKSTDAQSCAGGFASVLTGLLESYKQEAQDGMAIQMEDSCELIFIQDIILLSDHEGFRSALGCKGAAGLKPCLKCLNVLSNGKAEGVVGHVDVCQNDISKFQSMSLDMVADVAARLEAEKVQSKRNDLETLLGWKLSTLQRSVLLSPQLSDWFGSMNNIQYDSMHDYWSNGIVAQELGLWYSNLCWYTKKDIQHVCSYVSFGWKPVKNSQAENSGNPCHHFDGKLWKVGQDFRGDASACLLVLPLVVAYSEEMLRSTVPDMEPMLDSLQALYTVCVCLQRAKIDDNHVRSLLNLQTKHMCKFQLAYTTKAVRPKMHFALHIQEQAERLGKWVDCFVCERKHRVYKNTCSRGVVASRETFARTSLLQLVSKELQESLRADVLQPQLLGKMCSADTLSSVLPAGKPIVISTSAEVHGVLHGRGEFLLLSPTCVVEIQAAVQQGNSFFYLVEMLHLKATSYCKSVGMSTWSRKAAGEQSCALLPVSTWSRTGFTPSWMRATDDAVCLLE